MVSLIALADYLGLKSHNAVSTPDLLDQVCMLTMAQVYPMYVKVLEAQTYRAKRPSPCCVLCGSEVHANLPTICHLEDWELFMPVPPVKSAFYIQPRVPLPFCLRHSSLPLLGNYYPKQAKCYVPQSFLILPGTFTETFSLIYFFRLKKFLLQITPSGFTNSSSVKPRNKLNQNLVTVSYKVIQLLQLETDL